MAKHGPKERDPVEKFVKIARKEQMQGSDAESGQAQQVSPEFSSAFNRAIERIAAVLPDHLVVLDARRVEKAVNLTEAMEERAIEFNYDTQATNADEAANMISAIDELAETHPEHALAMNQAVMDALRVRTKAVLDGTAKAPQQFASSAEVQKTALALVDQPDQLVTYLSGENVRSEDIGHALVELPRELGRQVMNTLPKPVVIAITIGDLSIDKAAALELLTAGRSAALVREQLRNDKSTRGAGAFTDKNNMTSPILVWRMIQVCDTNRDQKKAIGILARLSDADTRSILSLKLHSSYMEDATTDARQELEAFIEKHQDAIASERVRLHELRLKRAAERAEAAELAGTAAGVPEAGSEVDLDQDIDLANI